MPKTLITGATGGFGKVVIETLLKKGFDTSDLFALVRDEGKAADLKAKGVTLRVGDYSDHAAMVAALKGIAKLLLVSSNDYSPGSADIFKNRTRQQLNVVKAAKEAGVRHIVYTSLLHKTDIDKLPSGFVRMLDTHLPTERAIIDGGFACTILQNNIYMELLPVFIGQDAAENGITVPAGDGGVGFALRAEMAEAAANVLASDGHENRSYRISGSSVSYSEVAGILSGLLGKAVEYRPSDMESYKDKLRHQGLSETEVLIFGGYADAIREGHLSDEGSDLQRLLGRKPASARDFLKRLHAS